MANIPILNSSRPFNNQKLIEYKIGADHIPSAPEYYSTIVMC